MGAITTRRQPSADGVMIGIHVPNLIAALNKAKSLGARVVQGRISLGSTIGDQAAIQDPDGNRIGLFESRLRLRRARPGKRDAESTD
jgi:predicted enzyme related to lactoylglutathione lyase